jgi:hypothetical protein
LGNFVYGVSNQKINQQEQVMKGSSGFGVAFVIIALATALLVSLAIWKVMDANSSQKNNTPTSTTTTNSPQPNYAEINELGVKFEKKDNIDPMYSIEQQNWNGTAYTLIALSTKQVSDSAPDCSFVRSDKSPGFTLISVFVYNSKDDVTRIEPGVTPEKITSANGYLPVGDKIYHIAQGIQEGQGICSDSNLETQQRVALRGSLMTLTVIH